MTSHANQELKEMNLENTQRQKQVDIDVLKIFVSGSFVKEDFLKTHGMKFNPNYEIKITKCLLNDCMHVPSQKLVLYKIPKRLPRQWPGLKNIFSMIHLIVKHLVVLMTQNLTLFSTDLFEGILFPEYWSPMTSEEVHVLTVPLDPNSPEFQDVSGKFYQTVDRSRIITKIERVQNPLLYHSYMVKKQKMDKDSGRNCERLLFHGTSSDRANKINIQGFNRDLWGRHGECRIFSIFYHFSQSH